MNKTKGSPLRNHKETQKTCLYWDIFGVRGYVVPVSCNTLQIFLLWVLVVNPLTNNFPAISFLVAANTGDRFVQLTRVLPPSAYLRSDQ
jgi:hypothetical protein